MSRTLLIPIGNQMVALSQKKEVQKPKESGRMIAVPVDETSKTIKVNNVGGLTVDKTETFEAIKFIQSLPVDKREAALVGEQREIVIRASKD